jgi:hypothetical protein
MDERMDERMDEGMDGGYVNAGRVHDEVGTEESADYSWAALP